MRGISAIAAVIVMVMAVWPGAVHAASGIGFAQAKEGNWYCRGDDPVSVLNCARQKCRAKAGAQAYYRTKWCYGAGSSTC